MPSKWSVAGSRVGLPGIVHAGGATRNDDPPAAGQFGGGSFARGDFRIDAQVPHLSRDEMAILPPSVKNGNLRLQVYSLL